MTYILQLMIQPQVHLDPMKPFNKDALTNTPKHLSQFSTLFLLSVWILFWARAGGVSWCQEPVETKTGCVHLHSCWLCRLGASGGRESQVSPKTGFPEIETWSLSGGVVLQACSWWDRWDSDLTDCIPSQTLSKAWQISAVFLSTRYISQPQALITCQRSLFQTKLVFTYHFFR